VTDRARAAGRIGLWAAVTAAFLAAVSFGVAATTPPRLMVAAFAGMSWYFGFGLECRFEVTAISIGWLTLMISGVLLAFIFRGATRWSRATRQVDRGVR
jgi:hypothetical protein